MPFRLPKFPPITELADLTRNEEAFARRVDFDHILNGDDDGGMHFAPHGSGIYGDSIVTRLTTSGKRATERSQPLDPNRTWCARVEIDSDDPDSFSKISYMFPTSWSAHDVLKATREAAIMARRTRQVWDSKGTYNYRGIDLIVRYQRDDPSRVSSVYPARRNQAADAVTELAPQT
jgi:hypothetical protein